MDFIRTRFILGFLVLILVGPVPVFCQQSHFIAGTVSDQETHSPLTGATIVLKGTVIGTAADQNGSFELLTKIEFPVTLEITLLGYQGQSILLKEQDQNL